MSRTRFDSGLLALGTDASGSDHGAASSSQTDDTASQRLGCASRIGRRFALDRRQTRRVAVSRRGCFAGSVAESCSRGCASCCRQSQRRVPGYGRVSDQLVARA